MKVIIGLGNPGAAYKETRHNFGFALLDKLSQKIEADYKYVKKIDSQVAEKELANQRIILVKPQTFMNNSGVAVKKLVDFYKIDIKDVVIVYDDLDIKLGTFRKTGIGSAGHLGMKSIMEILKLNKLCRYRLGINSLDRGLIPTDIFVLSKFAKSEVQIKETVINSVIQDILEDLGINT
jgi:PTH1 family peptidyl-tRNA hydrolase